MLGVGQLSNATSMASKTYHIHELNMCDDSCAANAPRSFWSVQGGAGVGVTLFLAQSVPLRDYIYKLKINTSL